MTTKLFQFEFEKQFEGNEIITQDKYMNICLKNPDLLEYVKIDVLYDNCKEWRGYDYNNYKITKPISVFAHGDFPLTDRLVEKYYQPCTKMLFSTNADCYYNTNVEGIPHGLTEDCDDTDTHRITGNKEILYDVLREPKVLKYICYMNFRMNTNFNLRAMTWNSLADKNFIYRKITEDNNINLEDRKQFLKDIYDSAFTICPRGNGIDTVRIWESLYCRTIPIVKREPAMRYFKDLPILWIDDWREIESHFWLDKQFARIMDSQWNLDKLRISYWEQRFLNAAKA